MCQKNVGRLDAFLRIAAGTVAVSVGIMKDRPSLATIGALKLASGVTRYCPIYDLLNVHTISDEEILEELGLVDEELEGYEPASHCGCGHHHHHHDDEDEEDAHSLEDLVGEVPYDGRRQYIHRAIKRNQYLSRELL